MEREYISNLSENPNFLEFFKDVYQVFKWRYFEINHAGLHKLQIDFEKILYDSSAYFFIAVFICSVLRYLFTRLVTEVFKSN
jgi:hypothetical protein